MHSKSAKIAETLNKVAEERLKTEVTAQLPKAARLRLSVNQLLPKVYSSLIYLFILYYRVSSFHSFSRSTSLLLHFTLTINCFTIFFNLV